MTTQSDLDKAAALLRAAGWTVLPPTPEQLPDAAPGQTWVSKKPRVEPRTIVRIGSHRMYPWAGDECIFFTTPSESERPSCLNPNAWKSWVKKAQAQPV